MPYALSTNPSVSTPDAERQAIVQALNNAIGNRQQAAENLGMSRSTLWRKMREYGIHR
jgi:transcriptional regulator of acetoin/glycerol metabolism